MQRKGEKRSAKKQKVLGGIRKKLYLCSEEKQP
jgi:hypothetical protein